MLSKIFFRNSKRLFFVEQRAPGLFLVGNAAPKLTNGCVNGRLGMLAIPGGEEHSHLTARLLGLHIIGVLKTRIVWFNRQFVFGI